MAHAVKGSQHDIDVVDICCHLLKNPGTDCFILENQALSLLQQWLEIKSVIAVLEHHRQAIYPIHRLQIKIVMAKDLPFPLLDEFIQELVQVLKAALLFLRNTRRLAHQRCWHEVLEVHVVAYHVEYGLTLVLRNHLGILVVLRDAATIN